jgi:NAD(P)-dependent dehydrogenase (short-subunit alcohol dehydrogenase family)
MPPAYIGRLDDAAATVLADPEAPWLRALCTPQNMSMTFQPVAVVTGAASGIGRAFVVLLQQRGYRCVAADIDTAGLEALAATPEGAGILAMPTDVSRSEDVERLAEATFALLGRADLVVNNAGVLCTGRSWELSEAQWRRVLDVNLLSVVHAVRSFVPRLIQQGSGHIVNIASMAALTSGALVGPYSMSKHGVLAISECVARELAQAGSALRVSVVFPDAVRTHIVRPLFDRAGQPAAPIDEVLDRVIAQGMAPEDMVRTVLDAIAGGAFGVFPHPEVRDAARSRLEQLLGGAVPA